MRNVQSPVTSPDTPVDTAQESDLQAHGLFGTTEPDLLVNRAVHGADYPVFKLDTVCQTFTQAG
jgi:hypothetical protein